MARQNHTLNMFEKDELIETLDALFAGIPDDRAAAYADMYEAAMAILGIDVNEGQDDYLDDI
jgi:hypothetical protein